MRTRLSRSLSVLSAFSAVSLLALGCVGAPPAVDRDGEGDASYATTTEALSSISCGERGDTGYVRGSAFGITVVTVDGKPVERETANAYYVMAQAASRAGVEIRIVSGFRTMGEQRYLYNCYTSCSCNSCNLAARPGYSNHQSGHALDLNTRNSSVLNWLNANGGRFGFRRTVAGEPWHWEWWGGGPGGGPCRPSCTPSCNGSRITSADCGVGDCGVFGATCVDDSLGVRCASVFCPTRGNTQVCLDGDVIGTCRDGAISTGSCGVFGAGCVQDDLGARCVSGFCPARGTTKVCLDETTIATCNDGGISTGDCGAFAAFCSTAGTTEARCHSAFCVSSPDEVPVEKDVCLPDGRIAHCNAQGLPENARACGAGTTCQAGGAGGDVVDCFAGGGSPTGGLDVEVDACEAIRGWATDPDATEQPIDVFLELAGDPGVSATVRADLARAEGCGDEAPCAHGFALLTPLSLHDGAEHAVSAFGQNIEGGGNAELTGSPLTLRCEAVLPPGFLRPVAAETFETWGFDEVHDLLPADPVDIAERVVGPALPALPELLRADGALWLIEDGVRRAVSPGSFAAFRFDEASVANANPAELMALPRGADLPPRPVLVNRGGQLHLVDDVLVDDGTGDGYVEDPPEGHDHGPSTGHMTGGCSSVGSPTSGGSDLPVHAGAGFAVALLLLRRRMGTCR